MKKQKKTKKTKKNKQNVMKENLKETHYNGKVENKNIGEHINKKNERLWGY